MIRAQFPNFSDRGKYSLALISSYYYSGDYPHFSWEQLETPIVTVVNNTAGLIDHGPYTVESVIKLMRMFLNPAYLGDKLPRATNEGLLFRCVRKDVGYLKWWFEEQLPTDEAQIEEYLDFISEMAKRVITEICDETEKYILEEAAKTRAPQPKQEAREKPRSFRERMRPRATEEEHNIATPSTHDESEPRVKRVRFANPLER